MKKQIKEKRKPLSLIRLWKLASQYINPNNATEINNFLKYISEHKNDEL